MQQASVTDYFKATKKRTRDPPDFSLGKSSKLLATSEAPNIDVPVPVAPSTSRSPNATTATATAIKEEVGQHMTTTHGSSRVRKKATRKVTAAVVNSHHRGDESASSSLQHRRQNESHSNPPPPPTPPVRFLAKGMLSPNKPPPPSAAAAKPQLNLKKILKSKGKLADLQAALEGINGCAQKLAEFRRNAAAATATPTTATATAPTVSPKKFYSPRKQQEDIFSSPTKLHQIQSPLKPPAQKRLFQAPPPAYQRFHALVQPDQQTATAQPTAQPGHPARVATPPSTGLPLPYKYKLLEELFNSVETVSSILHNRKELTTFQKVKGGVGQLLRQVALKEKHLQQILTVYPGCYTLAYEKVKGASTSQHQLVLAVNLEGQDLISATAMTARRRTFRTNLLNFAHTHHTAFLSGLCPPIVVEKTSVTRWHPRFQLDGVPEIPPTFPLPPCPDTQRDKVSTAKEVISRAQAILQNANPRMKKAVQDMVNGMNRKEEELSNKEESTLAGVAQELPKKKVNNLPALKGISQSLIEKIRAREQAKAISCLTESPEETRRKSIRTKLPDFVKIIRNIFIAEKKAALPLDVAVQRLAHSSVLHPNISIVEVEEHVRLLGVELPEWLQILSVSGGEEFVKMDRKLDINELIAKLVDSSSSNGGV